MKNVLSLLVLAAVATSVTISAEALTVVPGDYAKSFTITFPGYSGSSALTDFPVLVRISKVRNDFNYSACRVANGGDLRFADSGGNLLSSEVDTWNTSGESLVWVKIPSLDASTVITAYYGNANPPAVTASDVWSSGYVGVWHLSESGRYMTDSSRSDNPANKLYDSRNDGSVQTGQAGLVGNAVRFDVGGTHRGSLNTIDSRYSLSGSSGPFTVECWAYQDDHDPAENTRNIHLMSEVDSGNGWNSTWLLREMTSSPAGRICMEYLDDSKTSRYMFSDTAGVPPRAEWNHFVVRHDTSRLETRLNNSRITSRSVNLTLFTTESTKYLHIGNRGSGDNAIDAWPGLMDELRISNVARSDDWLQATMDCIKNADFSVCYATENDWTEYSHKFKVSFAGYAGGEALANFPVLVKVSESGISGFRYADCLKSNGGDLRFADAEGNLLASEVDTWDTNGVSLVWVKVPSLTAATEITAYYGWAFTPAVDSSAVWANGYVGVWHLNESTAPLAESSGISTPFTQGQVAPEYGAEGVLGKSVNFAANDESGTTDTRLEAADDDDLDGFDDFTVEYWSCQATFRPSGQWAAILSKRIGSGSQESWMVCLTDGNQYPSCFIRPNDGGTRTDMSAGRRVEANQWTHQAYTRVKTTGKQIWYFDGGSVANATSDNRSTLLAGWATLKLGGGAGQNSFPGSIDEVRISNVARSADWVKASHDTVTESAFAVYGTAKENGRKGIMIFIR